MVEQLSAGAQPVKVLAEPHAMALPSFLRHIEVLEAAGPRGHLQGGPAEDGGAAAEIARPARRLARRPAPPLGRAPARLEAVARRLELETNPMPGRPESGRPKPG
ncbi:MAG: transcriptional regulator [Paracoccaceae bacterium]